MTRSPGTKQLRATLLMLVFQMWVFIVFSQNKGEIQLQGLVCENEGVQLKYIKCIISLNVRIVSSVRK